MDTDEHPIEEVLLRTISTHKKEDVVEADQVEEDRRVQTQDLSQDRTFEKMKRFLIGKGFWKKVKNENEDFSVTKEEEGYCHGVICTVVVLLLL
ncbi:hypothetical protein NDU88_009563 [Pleurodeles waltl]|uniref:Uncharacterized protein n=1 Tax=Pleurodeles waltl TaxID=8319 RepID=A0AAV7RVK9_PLEWA|nr:hypothetical protein NDU88_009563 [Pleurodeles waltl]